MNTETWSKLKVALLLSYLCVASLSAAIITPALPLIEVSYHLSHGSLEWIVSIFLIGYVFGQLIYGPLANQYGRKRALQGGLCLNLLGILLCLFATWQMSYPLLLLGRLLTALGAAAGLSCTFMLLNESLPDERVKSIMPYCGISFTIGVGLAVFIGGWVTEHWGWTNCFWVLLAHGVLMLLGTACFKETLQSPSKQSLFHALPSLFRTFRNNRVVTFSLIVGLCSSVGYCYSAAAPLYAHSVLGLSAGQYGSWTLVPMIGMLFGGFLAAYWMKRHSVYKTMFLALALMLPLLLVLLVLWWLDAKSPLRFFTTFMLLNLLGGVLFTTGSYCASNASADKASAASAMSFINMGSATLAVVVLGYLPLQPLASLVAVLSVFFALAVALAWVAIQKA